MNTWRLTTALLTFACPVAAQGLPHAPAGSAALGGLPGAVPGGVLGGAPGAVAGTPTVQRLVRPRGGFRARSYYAPGFYAPGFYGYPLDGGGDNTGFAGSGGSVAGEARDPVEAGNSGLGTALQR